MTRRGGEWEWMWVHVEAVDDSGRIVLARPSRRTGKIRRSGAIATRSISSGPHSAITHATAHQEAVDYLFQQIEAGKTEYLTA